MHDDTQELGSSARASLQDHRVEAIRQLAAGIAHEFANSLTAIGGIAHLIQSDGAVDDQSQQDLDEIRKITEEAAFLARELMAFGAAGVAEPSRRRLGDVVRQLRRILPHVVPRHVRVVERLAAHDIEVWADPQQLNEVAIVLAAYARQHLGAGGELLLEARQEEFEVRDASKPGMGPGPYGVIEIISGAPPEPHGPSVDSPGMLGDLERSLSTAGCALQVRPRTDGGRGFVIYLPIAGQAAPATPPAGGDETILLIEDDEDLAEVVARMLQTRGYQVLRATDGDAGLRLAESVDGPIHLLLSDVVIPGTRGLDLLRRFQTVQPGARALFMSGYEAGVGEGIPFLRKPFEAGALTRKIREVLDAP